MTNNLVVVILAAGKGTRMNSEIPKVLHKVGNKTMIEKVVSTAKELYPSEIIIVVSKENMEPIAKVLKDFDVRFKIQAEQLGTAHAVISAYPWCDDGCDLLILLGDVPLIRSSTLNKIINNNYDAVIIGFINKNLDNQFGRVVLNNNKVIKIVEYSDATDREKEIKLCNSGMMWIKSDYINLLWDISNNNNKQEYYLTDIVKIMGDKNLNIGFLEALIDECIGVNTRSDLFIANSYI